MTSLNEIPSVLRGPVLLGALTGMGLAVGLLTGLFGIGGGVIVTPLLNVLLGIPYPLAAGSSLSFTLGTSSGGWVRHMRLGNVEHKTAIAMSIAAACGAVLGGQLHMALKSSLREPRLTLTLHALFILTLAAVAWLTWRQPLTEAGGRCLLERLPLPPRISIGSEQVRRVSLPGLLAAGAAGGVFGGLLGIGGGAIFVPLLLLVVGLSIRQAVGTSLGVVLFLSLAGVLTYGLRGQASIWIVGPLLLGSGFGVQAGAWLCQRLEGPRIRRSFAVLVLLVAACIAADFVAKYRRL